MQRTPKLYEKELYSVWQNQSFQNPLETISGDKITVHHPGEFNKDTSGPDFLNARIQIGNLTFVGDVEIDRDYNDWKRHGHNIDKRYNKVVLHISFTNKFHQNYVYTKEGRKIPSLCLSDFVSEEEINLINEKLNNIEKELSTKLRCLEHRDEIPYYKKKKIIAELGIHRFEKKSVRMFSRLKELRYLNELNIKEPVISYELSEEYQNKKFNPEDFTDKELWKQLLYEFIFEALGYSKNKVPMLKLARLLPLSFFSKLGDDEEFDIFLETMFFNVSGLIPKDKIKQGYQSTYEEDLIENWKTLSRIYDGIIMDETDWHFFQLRPQNFPTIRIAGGLHIAKQIYKEDLVASIIKKFMEVKKISLLIGLLRSLFIIKSYGYWQNHYVFNKKSESQIKYFVGSGRADEIMVNVVLPFLSVYFEIFGKPDLAKKVLKVYSAYHQSNTNKIVREVAENIDMEEEIKKTVIIQGMIELFRSYCSKNKCLECSIGKQVFN